MQTQNTNQLNVKTQVYRYAGKWVLKLTAPRWLIDELYESQPRISGGSFPLESAEDHLIPCSVQIEFEPIKKD
jgi:hypothetical protein